MEIHHIGYLVKNIQKSITEYETLGFTLVSNIVSDGDRLADICFMKNNDYCIELISPWKESTLIPLLKRYKYTGYHICYKVRDINKSIEILQKKGFFLFQEPQRAQAIGVNAKVAFLMGSESGMLELVQENI